MSTAQLLSGPQRSALQALAGGARTAVEVGDRVYAGKRKRQAYARPAAKILRSLATKGLAEEYMESRVMRPRFRWRLTKLGQEESGREMSSGARRVDAKAPANPLIGLDGKPIAYVYGDALMDVYRGWVARLEAEARSDDDDTNARLAKQLLCSAEDARRLDALARALAAGGRP